MSELKTLNDLEFQEPKIIGIAERVFSSPPKEGINFLCRLNQDLISKRDLRQGVIKWVKEFEIELQKFPEIIALGMDGRLEQPKEPNKIIIGDTEINCDELTKEKIKLALTAWVKHFFNLTEEDFHESKEVTKSGKVL